MATRGSVSVDDVAQGVVAVTLDRPEKLNAIDGACLEELVATMSELARRGNVRAAILTGAGSVFSAGADIGSLGELQTKEDHRARLRLFADMFRSLETAPFPIIAAVNGLAYGAGLELVLASDIAVSTSSARFALKEASVGLMPTFALVRGPEIIGKRATLRLAMTGAEVGAQEARDLGLVTDVVEPDDLMPTAMSIASTLLTNAPLAVVAAKRFLNDQASDDALSSSIDATTRLFATGDHQEGVSAFRERRTPNFLGE